MTAKPTLRFRRDGTFKLLQLTDMHIRPQDSLNDPSLALMQALIAREQPDLVAFTGDIFCDDAPEAIAAAWSGIDAMLAPGGIPYTVTLGNHESDGDSGRQHALAAALERLPRALFEAGDPALGVGNYAVPVLSHGGNRTAFVLYHLDSHSSTFPSVRPDGTTSLREWYVYPEQLTWLESAHNALRAENGATPALLFHHNPLPEYDQLWMFDGVWGDHGEMVCRAPVNSGLFALLYRLTDFRGVFAGHDHTNSFAGDMMGITLAYGRCSGNYRWCLWPTEHADRSAAFRQPTDGSPPAKDYFLRGGRVIVLDETSGRIADTYVVLEDGTRETPEYHPPMYRRFDYYLYGAAGTHGPDSGEED